MIKPGLKRIALTIIVVAVILVLVHQILRRPVHAADIPGTFSRLENCLETEDWENAAEAMQEFKEKWNRVRMRILLNAGFDSLLLFESAMARLERAIRREALLEAQLELAEIRVIWREFITF